MTPPPLSLARHYLLYSIVVVVVIVDNAIDDVIVNVDTADVMNVDVVATVWPGTLFAVTNTVAPSDAVPSVYNRLFFY